VLLGIGKGPLDFTAEILPKPGICSVSSMLVLLSLKNGVLASTVEILFELYVCLSLDVPVPSDLNNLLTFAAEKLIRTDVF
jgi:hypothetical protein